MELDEGAADLDTVGAGRAGIGRVEAERDVRLGRGCRVGRVERDMVEVELDLGRRLDQAQAEALGDVEVGLAVARPLDLDVLGEVGERVLDVGDAQRHVLERAALAGPFLGEERQLAAARVGSDQGERVGAIDDVHADAAGDEVRDAVAVRDPEGDVVEGLRLHGEEHSRGGRA